jgi:hypothetical protein
MILDLLFTSKWTISARYRAIGSNNQGYITNVYGPPMSLEKPNFLKKLKYVKDIIQNNICILGGDFNIILSLAENRGDIPRLDKNNLDFKDFIEDS